MFMAHVRTRAEDEEGRGGMGRTGSRGCRWGGMKKLVCVSEGRSGMRRRQRASIHGASFGMRTMQHHTQGTPTRPVRGTISTNEGSACPGSLVPLGLSIKSRCG